MHPLQQWHFHHHHQHQIVLFYDSADFFLDSEFDCFGLSSLEEDSKVRVREKCDTVWMMVVKSAGMRENKNQEAERTTKMSPVL